MPHIRATLDRCEQATTGTALRLRAAERMLEAADLVSLADKVDPRHAEDADMSTRAENWAEVKRMLAAKDQAVADRDATIADLEKQLTAAAGSPADQQADAEMQAVADQQRAVEAAAAPTGAPTP